MHMFYGGRCADNLFVCVDVECALLQKEWSTRAVLLHTVAGDPQVAVALDLARGRPVQVSVPADTSSQPADIDIAASSLSSTRSFASIPTDAQADRDRADTTETKTRSTRVIKRTYDEILSPAPRSW